MFRLILGLCPTLAVTTSSQNGLATGIAATFVLIGLLNFVEQRRKRIGG